MKEFPLKYYFYNFIFPVFRLFAFIVAAVISKPNRFLNSLFYKFTEYNLTLVVLDFNQYRISLFYAGFLIFYVFSIPIFAFYIYTGFSYSTTISESLLFFTLLTTLILFHRLGCIVWFFDIRLAFVNIFSSFFTKHDEPFLNFTRQDASQRINTMAGDFLDITIFSSFFGIYLLIFSFYFRPLSYLQWIYRSLCFLIAFYFFGGDISIFSICTLTFIITELNILSCYFFKFITRTLSLNY